MSRQREERDRASRSRWTAEDVRRLGLTTNLRTAAEILGIGRDKIYQLEKTGQLPIRTLKLGRTIRVPVQLLLRELGYEESPVAAARGQHDGTRPT